MVRSDKPEAFHVEKDLLCKELGTLANQFDPPRARTQPSTTWRP